MTQTIELTNWTLDGEMVQVPHDAMLSAPRVPEAALANQGSYFTGGVYEYACELDVPIDWANKIALLEFEGVMGHTKVYVGEALVAAHNYGYTGFVANITRYLRLGETATIRVVVNNERQPSSRWYPGGGIYRPVRLILKPQNHITLDGVRITTEFVEPAQIRVQTQVVGIGVPYVRIERDGQAIAGRSGADVRLGIADAALWSADAPNLYTCVVTLRDARGNALDEARVPFGIRMLAWGEKGLLINGVPTKLRGGCVHSDNGILGATDLPEASRRKVAILKQWGFNAIRSAHNPLSRGMLDACDELGMYVIDEYADMWYRHKNPFDYACDFEECHADDLAAMVYKDINHPSVIMYSIGNENVEPVEERGVLTARLLANTVRRLDETRPVTAGVNPTILFAAGLGIDSFNGDGGGGVNGTGTGGVAPARGAGQTGALVDTIALVKSSGVRDDDTGNKSANASLAFNTYVAKMGVVMERLAGTWPVGRAVAPYLDELDIAGYNYGTRRYAPDLRAHPERPVYGAETMPYDIARNWRLVESDPRIVGDFMWAAWDYLGECSLAAWSDDPTPVSKPYPWLCADTGALDLIGDPTGEAAMAKAVWCAPIEPLLYVRPVDLPKPYTAPWRGTNSIPCWSWRGCEGTTTTVEIHTQAPIAKLYLNGRHVGTRRVRNCYAEFRVRYEPGELAGVVCNASGLELGRSTLVSAQGPLGLRLAVERVDGRVAFVRVDVADKAGVVEGTRNDEVTVTVEGGELLAFGSAAQASERSYLSGTFPVRYGRGLAIVRLDGDAPCTLVASAPALGETRLTI